MWAGGSQESHKIYKKQRWDPEIWHPPPVGCTEKVCPLKLWAEPLTDYRPGGDQHPPGMTLIHCLQCELISHYCCIETIKKTTKTKRTLQALIAHSLSHVLLRACRQVTGETNTCYLLVSAPGAKVTPFSSRFSSQALHGHISRWSFSRSQEGHCCSGWGLQCSRISFLFHVWHDQGTAQLSQRDPTTSPMFGKLPAWKVPYPGDKHSDVAAPL